MEPDRPHTGVLDSPLTAKGQEQAVTLGKILKSKIGTPAGFSQFVSPLGRTVQTANGIKQHFNFAPVQDERLKEVALGDIAGMTLFEISQEFPDHLEGKKKDWNGILMPLAEKHLKKYLHARTAFG